jgi:hypothetical protein
MRRMFDLRSGGGIAVVKLTGWFHKHIPVICEPSGETRAVDLRQKADQGIATGSQWYEVHRWLSREHSGGSNDTNKSQIRWVYRSIVHYVHLPRYFRIGEHWVDRGVLYAAPSETIHHLPVLTVGEEISDRWKKMIKVVHQRGAERRGKLTDDARDRDALTLPSA